ncbi:MAG: hypothetical protein M1829_001972 [Trizodia sp. TS-e1964]|nr:MAG: hypothetical protein M1829_001972 [Trizodia sp. TS-e1964]
MSSSPPLLTLPPLNRDGSSASVTEEQIRCARDLHPIAPGKVLLLSDSSVLKSGPDVKMAEAHTLQLLAQLAPSVPVPILHDAYIDEEGKGYIRMSKLAGEPLSKHWIHMSDCERQSITKQLARHFREWRKIRGSFLGAVDAGPCPDSIFGHAHGFSANQTPSYGPYSNRREFCAGVVEALRNSRPKGKVDSLDQQTVERIVADAANISLDDSCDDDDDTDTAGFVLTHGDLHMGNVLVLDGRVRGIVDWSEAGYSIKERENLETKCRSGKASWKQAVDSIVTASSAKIEHWSYIINEMMAYSGI